MPPSKKSQTQERIIVDGDSRTKREVVDADKRGTSAKSGKPVLVVDETEDESDASVVSVARTAKPKVTKPVAGMVFGTVDSDDEVQVAVRDRRPVLKPGRSVVPVSSDVVPSTDMEDGVVSDTGLSVDTNEPFLVIDKKRRPTSDENDSPSKIRVSDLTLSPRKAASASERPSSPTPDPGARRIGARTRKPTAKLMSGRDSGSTLLKRLDEVVVDELEDLTSPIMSDSSYRPRKPRSPAKTRSGKGKGRASGKATSLSEVKEDQDVPMRSPSPLALNSDSKPAEAVVVEYHVEGKPTPTEGSHGRLSESIGDGKVKQAKTSNANANLADGKVKQAKSSNGNAIVVKGWVVCSFSAVHALGFDVLQSSSMVSAKRKTASAVDKEEPPSDKALILDKSVFSGSVALLDDEEDEVADDFEDESGSPPAEPLLDDALIHPDLEDLYRSLTWINALRRTKFIGYPNMEDAFDDFKPVSYGTLVDTVNPRVKSKLVRSVLFMGYKDFRNPSRASLENMARYWECLRLPRSEGNRNVPFVMSGVCMQSFVGQGREVGQSFVKQLFVRPLENDWEIFQANLGSFFHDDFLHAPGRRSTLVFQTKREGWSPRQFDKEGDKLASTPYASPSKGARGKATASPSQAPESSDFKANDTASVADVNLLTGGSPPYRLFDEGVPLYDGRTKPGCKGFRFEPADWETYTKLPRYPHPEVESNSLVTVAFTLTGFKGTNNTHHTVHFNALFAIVLGKVDG
ncbi:hypothetical protein VNI00_012688 [Paramarasmius palmivorus]|uniref:Uncharacterized protein n=1 Tax=Paramarasmius palmivorus TaxID=297713 RepID=A0AAW0C3H1_9AGAR